MPTESSSLAVAAGSENIHFIGTPTTLAGTISGVGVVFIGSPVVGVPSDPSPISDGGGEAVVEGSGCQGREPPDESSFCPGLARCFDCGFASAQDRMTSACLREVIQEIPDETPVKSATIAEAESFGPERGAACYT